MHRPERKTHDMPRPSARILTGFTLALAFAIPVAASLCVSHRMAWQEQEFRTSIVAAQVLHRADAVSEQIGRTAAALRSRVQGPPCSAANIATMRNLAIGASYLQDVGYMEGDVLRCSSYGDHGAGIPLGHADYLSSNRMWIRRSVSLPFDANQKFFAVTGSRSGFTIVALPDLILDAGSEAGDISIALVAISNRKVIFQRGDIDHDQLPAFTRDGGMLTWQHRGSVGVVRFSPQNDYAAVAVSPASAVNDGMKRTAMWLVPFGVLLGIACLSMVRTLIRQRGQLPAQIDRALRRDELSLAYMPIVEMSSGKWVGAEALLRWQRHDGVAIAPDQFIPAAEQNGRIRKVTSRMLELLARDARELPRQIAADLYLSVNLSAQDLADPAIIEDIREAKQASGISCLMVEATEGALLHAAPVMANISVLQDQGIHFAIDDFGTGYSNLSYLGSLDVDCLKIDQSFVQAIGTDSVRSLVITHIVALAREAGLSVIAEGVETPEQATFLFARGVAYAQGWLYGKPMPMSEFVRAAVARAGSESVGVAEAAEVA